MFHHIKGLAINHKFVPWPESDKDNGQGTVEKDPEKTSLSQEDGEKKKK